MPLFFLHQRCDDILIEDPDGSELPNLEAARAEALDSARQLWAEAILGQRDLSGYRFEISDDAGKVLATVAFEEALPASLRH